MIDLHSACQTKVDIDTHNSKDRRTNQGRGARSWLLVSVICHGHRRIPPDRDPYGSGPLIQAIAIVIRSDREMRLAPQRGYGHPDQTIGSQFASASDNQPGQT